MTTSVVGLSAAQLERLREVLTAHDVRLAVLFGSATDRSDPEDVDIASELCKQELETLPGTRKARITALVDESLAERLRSALAFRESLPVSPSRSSTAGNAGRPGSRRAVCHRTTRL